MFFRLLNSVLVIVLSYVLLKIIQYLLKEVFKITKFDVRYENTLFSVLSSVSYYIIFITCIILILRELKIVDVTKFSTIVTGASIVGLVAGVASQSILKDIFNGFFILFEKQIQVGDFVLINEKFRGVVEDIGLRSTSIRSWELKRITLSNGNISSIENYSKEKMRVIVSVRVSYEEDPNKVLEILHQACDIINNTYEESLLRFPNGNIESSFKVYGVTDIESPIGAKYTITGIVRSENYFKVLRETKLEILNTFRKNNVHIAYPTHINILYSKEKYDYIDDREL